jgi:hypothetical protein
MKYFWLVLLKKAALAPEKTIELQNAFLVDNSTLDKDSFLAVSLQILELFGVMKVGDSYLNDMTEIEAARILLLLWEVYIDSNFSTLFAAGKRTNSGGADKNVFEPSREIIAFKNILECTEMNDFLKEREGLEEDQKLDIDIGYKNALRIVYYFWKFLFVDPKLNKIALYNHILEDWDYGFQMDIDAYIKILKRIILKLQNSSSNAKNLAKFDNSVERLTSCVKALTLVEPDLNSTKISDTMREYKTKFYKLWISIINNPSGKKPSTSSSSSSSNLGLVEQIFKEHLLDKDKIMQTFSNDEVELLFSYMEDLNDRINQFRDIFITVLNGEVDLLYHRIELWVDTEGDTILSDTMNTKSSNDLNTNLSTVSTTPSVASNQLGGGGGKQRRSPTSLFTQRLEQKKIRDNKKRKRNQIERSPPNPNVKIINLDESPPQTKDPKKARIYSSPEQKEEDEEEEEEDEAEEIPDEEEENDEIIDSIQKPKPAPPTPRLPSVLPPPPPPPQPQTPKDKERVQAAKSQQKQNNDKKEGNEEEEESIDLNRKQRPKNQQGQQPQQQQKKQEKQPQKQQQQRNNSSLSSTNTTTLVSKESQNTPRNSLLQPQSSSLLSTSASSKTTKTTSTSSSSLSSSKQPQPSPRSPGSPGRSYSEVLLSPPQNPSRSSSVPSSGFKQGVTTPTPTSTPRSRPLSQIILTPPDVDGKETPNIEIQQLITEGEQLIAEFEKIKSSVQNISSNKTLKNKGDKQKFKSSVNAEYVEIHKKYVVWVDKCNSTNQDDDNLVTRLERINIIYTNIETLQKRIDELRKQKSWLLL